MKIGDEMDRGEEGNLTSPPSPLSSACAQERGNLCGTTPGVHSEIELPFLAAALVLDEWRRATMEGQGGWFVRLPRERYDGQGNLWTVVRRAIDNVERIVVIREDRQYQAMSSSNDLRRYESELGHVRKILASTESDLAQARGAGKPLRIAKLTETLEAVREKEISLAASVEQLRSSMPERELREWSLPLDLAGVAMRVSCDG